MVTDHPETRFQERYARDALTSFMISHGFKVTSGYLGLETAWRAEYVHGSGGKVALKVALETHNIPGKIILLGTPAEEEGGGKIILLERGGYEEMDFCVMSHPGPGPLNSFAIGSTIAMQTFQVEYIGQSSLTSSRTHSAHAGGAPWYDIDQSSTALNTDSRYREGKVG
ncbi:hypothetical protein D9757_005801 [Collybiopsis confluens]|uniref:Uncharacterized protein n=1 Tax=Collybiopsis confluens TaxID=2823264 RepID=A0A8H5MAW7_9AGAR|nr:hypothetical protein D9757_005801 [Collybiopsis confluens]